jgi:periplasmic protein CpxP/Spy
VFRTMHFAGLLGLMLLPIGTFAQQCAQPAPGNNAGGASGPPPLEFHRPPMERAFHAGPHGRWWNNPELAQKLNLTTDQQKKMEAIFEQSRPNLSELLGTVHNEEAAMDPLLAAEHPDDNKILAQIDRVAQARAELERANGRMLLGLRKVLTPDQWKTLQSFEPHGPFPHFGGGFRPDGPPHPQQ